MRWLSNLILGSKSTRLGMPVEPAPLMAAPELIEGPSENCECNALEFRPYEEWRHHGYRITSGERPKRIIKQGAYTIGLYCRHQVELRIGNKSSDGSAVAEDNGVGAEGILPPPLSASATSTVTLEEGSGSDDVGSRPVEPFVLPDLIAEEVGSIDQLLEELADSKRAFFVQDLPTEALGAPAISEALWNDHRFVEVETDHFATKATLFDRTRSLTLDLAKGHQARLAEPTFAHVLSSLRRDGQWEQVPPEIAGFLQRLGLCSPSCEEGYYVFPLARALAGCSVKVQSLASEHLRATAPERALEVIPQGELEGCISGFLSLLDERLVKIIRARHGLGTPRRTLEEVGATLGVTRERIRQLEARFFDRVPKGSSRQVLRPLVGGFLDEVMRRQGDLVFSETDPNVRFIARCLGVSITDLPGTGLIVLGLLPVEEYLPIGIKLPNGRAIVSQVVLSGHQRLTAIERSHLQATSKPVGPGPTKAQRVVAILETIGKPAHYSEVAARYNEAFPGDASSAHVIHATLGRCADVVWIGTKGTFALTAWGYARPERPLFDQVAEIVRTQYALTGKAVPRDFVVSELGRTRRLLNRNSLEMALTMNAHVTRSGKNLFVPAQETEEEPPEGDDSLDGMLRAFEESADSES